MKRSPLVRKTPLQSHKPLSSEKLRIPSDAAKLTVKPKKRSCKACKTKFETVDGMRSWCSIDCGAEIAQQALAKKKERDAKEARKGIFARKEAIKTRSDYLKEAQIAFNAFIRARDGHLPCISCGRFHEGSWDAGHYRSVGSMPALRFNEDNCHRQCVPCNQHKAGNVVEYRIGLVARIGADRVESLEGPHEPVKYDIEEIKAIKQHYKEKLKALKAAGTD